MTTNDKEIAEAIDKDSFTEFSAATVRAACIRIESASYSYTKSEEWTALVALVNNFDAVISDYRVWR